MKNKHLTNMLPPEFFSVSPQLLARNLLGKLIVFNNNGNRLSAIIVETEAYLSSGDNASHSAPGLTARNAPMFEDGGTTYVYKIYGIHHCFNIVSETIGIGSAVLIRSAEPFEGIDIMMKNRNTDKFINLLKGPGNFCKAIGLGLLHNNLSCYSNEISLSHYLDISETGIVQSKRIGIRKSSDLLLRYYIKGNCFVSGNHSG